MIPDELKRIKPMSGKERLGAHRDSDYLGAEDIEPGTEPIVTISALYHGKVTLQRGKEDKDVIAFAEETVPGITLVRPLICNSTNRKTLRKLYKAVSADALVGKRIQLYVDSNVRDPSTGERTDGIRIRPRVPAPARTEPIICEDCGNPIAPFGRFSADDVAKMAQQKHGAKLCAACGKKRSDALEAAQTSPEETEQTEQEES